jgi:hypothetical protein
LATCRDFGDELDRDELVEVLRRYRRLLLPRDDLLLVLDDECDGCVMRLLVSFAMQLVILSIAAEVAGPIVSCIRLASRSSCNRSRNQRLIHATCAASVLRQRIDELEGERGLETEIDPLLEGVPEAAALR